jgi:hypothetical protein
MPARSVLAVVGGAIIGCACALNFLLSRFAT